MRKRLLKKLLALGSSLCMIMCLMPTAVHANDTAAVKYVALGDSITSGYGVNESQAFPSLIAEKQNYTVVNHGQAGLTSEGLLASLEDSDVAKDVATADIISITIGGNDLMNALYAYLAEKMNLTVEDVKNGLAQNNTAILISAITHIPEFSKSEIAINALDTFGSKLSQIIFAIKKANPGAMLFVAKQYNPYQWLAQQCQDVQYAGYIKPIVDTFDVGVTALNTIIDTAQENMSGAFVSADVYSAFKNSQVNLANASYTSITVGSFVQPKIDFDFHPNAAGHQVIADTMIAAIDTSVEAVLKKGEATLTALGTLSVEQKDVSTLENAQTWVTSQIKTLSLTGMNVAATVDQFVLATAGTANQPTGTNGSFNMRVTLQYAGQSKTVDVPVVIKASAYTAPAANDNKTEADNKQTQKADKVTSVNTGDSTNIIGYTVMMISIMVLINTIHKSKTEY